jgi:haloacid dehalogenase superfamily, subfamily IA, variant 3 with third motif having DD or ED
VEIDARGFLFDMDGTTVNSNPVVEATWARFAQPRGIDLQELLKFSHGRLAISTLERFMPGSTVEERRSVEKQLLEWETSKNDGVTEIPGAKKLFEALTRLDAPKALVTSAVIPLAKKRFEVVGIDYPEVAITAELVGKGKPDPEGYLLAAKRLGLDARDCVVFEDAGPGAAAGLAAGAKVIVVGSDASETTRKLPRVANLEHVTVTTSPEPGWFRLHV